MAPRTGLRRERARRALDLSTRAYAGAAIGRHTAGWSAGDTSADAEIAGAGTRLRERSRDLVRNNPHAAKAVSSWVSNIVGDGIMPRAVTGNPATDKKVMAAFNKWAKQCDADGQLDFYGLQTLACREMIEAGEVLARRRRRRASDGLVAPVQVQIIEGDLLDSAKTGYVQGGNVAILGVEFSPIGQRQAYWLYAQHPGFNFVSFTSRIMSAPVAAEDVIHLYEKQRTQVRGVPWATPIVRPLRDLDDYEFAEIVRKKSESCIVAIVSGDEESQEGVGPKDVDSTGNLVVDSDGRVLEKMQPGMIAYARGGKQINFNSPAVVAGYGDYKRASLKTIAAGFRMPYELLSGDLSEVNFSSIRAGLIEYRRLVSAMQWQIFIPMFCQRIWDWFVDAAFLAGEIDVDVVPVEWSPPKFEWVDPYKDALAELLAIRSGTRTWREVVSEHGRNPDDVLAEIIAHNAALDKGNVTLDSDPRRVNKVGTAQVFGGDAAQQDGLDIGGGLHNRSVDWKQIALLLMADVPQSRQLS